MRNSFADTWLKCKFLTVFDVCYCYCSFGTVKPPRNYRHDNFWIVVTHGFSKSAEYDGFSQLEKRHTIWWTCCESENASHKNSEDYLHNWFQYYLLANIKQCGSTKNDLLIISNPLKICTRRRKTWDWRWNQTAMMGLVCSILETHQLSQKYSICLLGYCTKLLPFTRRR